VDEEAKLYHSDDCVCQLAERGGGFVKFSVHLLITEIPLESAGSPAQAPHEADHGKGDRGRS
jgi:hypothetical protein